ncbi:acyl-homoserine-lactone synthase [Chelatococcus reniformis]|nr:acyl-homoserine-lactone synthase [Chelatococcus reniformis]
MAIVVSGQDSFRRSELMDDVYRFRHKYFVEYMRWHKLRKPDGREIDQFDTEDAVHIIEHAADGSVEAYSRLLPTMKPHLLTHVYPEILQGAPAPQGPTIWELTRCAVPVSKSETRAFDPRTRRIMLAVVETSLRMGVTGLVMEGRLWSLQRLMEYGWDIVPLASPVMYDDYEIAPFFAYVDEAMLHSTREALGIYEPVLEPVPSLLVA